MSVPCSFIYFPHPELRLWDMAPRREQEGRVQGWAWEYEERLETFRQEIKIDEMTMKLQPPSPPAPAFYPFLPHRMATSWRFSGITVAKFVMSSSRVTVTGRGGIPEVYQLLKRIRISESFWQALQANRSDRQWLGFTGHAGDGRFFTCNICNIPEWFFVKLQFLPLMCSRFWIFLAVQSTEWGVAMTILIVIFPSELSAYEQACIF